MLTMPFQAAISCTSMPTFSKAETGLLTHILFMFFRASRVTNIFQMALSEIFGCDFSQAVTLLTRGRWFFIPCRLTHLWRYLSHLGRRVEMSMLDSVIVLQEQEVQAVT